MNQFLVSPSKYRQLKRLCWMKVKVCVKIKLNCTSCPALNIKMAIWETRLLLVLAYGREGKKLGTYGYPIWNRLNYNEVSLWGRCKVWESFNGCHALLRHDSSHRIFSVLPSDLFPATSASATTFCLKVLLNMKNILIKLRLIALPSHIKFRTYFNAYAHADGNPEAFLMQRIPWRCSCTRCHVKCKDPTVTQRF